jgi:hypothetical protein
MRSLPLVTSKSIKYLGLFCTFCVLLGSHPFLIFKSVIGWGEQIKQVQRPGRFNIRLDSENPKFLSTQPYFK